MDSRRSHKCKGLGGSALVLVVVLVSLLAVVGMMFLMTARVNNMGVSAVSENKELGFAVETVIAKIGERLAADVPGSTTDSNIPAEYYDYPGPNDPWLAALEPILTDIKDPNDANDDVYRWPQISDVYNRLDVNNLQAIIIPDYQKPSDVGDSNSTDDYPADADGDGVADSRWIEVNDITSNKGKPIYAAIRIVDNGGMINVNTIFADPNVGDKCKGDMLTNIYIDGLVKSGTDLITTFLGNRSNAPDAGTYYLEAARRIENPDTTTNYYTFYDISEELSLRNRYVLLPGQSSPTQPWLSSMTRLESYGPPQCLSTTLRASRYGNSYTPYTSSDFGSWKRRFEPLYDTNEPIKSNYDFRHLLTTYNFDRIINPIGSGFNYGKMANVNRDDDVGKLYSAIYAGLYDANFAGNPFETAAQMTVNLVDFRDNDSNVTVYLNSDDSKDYYGFESPCIYISELAHNFTVSGDPPTVYRSYAVELYKPYSGDNDPCGWQLEIGGTPITIDNWTGNKQFYVIQDQNSNAPLEVDLGAVVKNETFTFTGDTEIELRRPASGDYVTVDWYKVDPCIPAPWLSEDDSPHSIQRDIQPYKCIRRLWASVARNDDDDLGKGNTFVDSDPNVVQAHPANTAFTNVGEIGMLFRKDVYSDIVRGAVESDVRLNLADPNFQQLFRYLTVFDPNSDTIDNDGDGLIDALDTNIQEYKVAGRININTAPWYVIAQLPWMQYQDGTPFERAKAVSDYRDNMLHCFGSIGELMQVPEMQSLAYDGSDNLNRDDPNGPDFTNDTARNDFEERDIIFSRISNLVTVRSDVFTAYILVRLGTDGPQKRVIAILDRSSVTNSGGRVKVVALHLVPDPR
jgi:hypothetical protein